MLHRSALSTDLVAAVVQMISTDELAAGQAIPALRPLAQRFGVAVPTMREALRRLEGVGILEFRHGSGVYVGPNANRMVLASALAPRPTRGQLEQLLQGRLVIEPPIAALAATVLDPAGVAQLEHALTDAHGCLLVADPRLAAANVDIHRCIAVVTGTWCWPRLSTHWRRCMPSIRRKSWCCTGIPSTTTLAWFVMIFSWTVSPTQMILMPLFCGFVKFDLYDKRIGMILVYTVLAIPFAAFVMRNFFSGIAREIFEAAGVDGASTIRTFFQIYLPMSVSALQASRSPVELGRPRLSTRT